MIRMLSFLGLLLLPMTSSRSAEFSVLVYNVENLFDLDGVALFEDYEQDADSGYGVDALLNKVEGIRRTLVAINSGEGPEIILFQEFELDRTPFDTPDPEAFLKETSGRSLKELLENESSAMNLPAELLLLKYLEDNGLSGYLIAQPLASLEEMSEADRVELLGELFQLDLPLVSNRPPRVRVGELELEVYSPVTEIRQALSCMQPGDQLNAIADLDVFRGNLQVVIREGSWLRQ